MATKTKISKESTSPDISESSAVSSKAKPQPIDVTPESVNHINTGIETIR